MFKTKKEARASGFVNQKFISTHRLVLKDGTVPVIVKGEEFFSRKDILPLISKTEGHRRRLKLKSGATPTSKYTHYTRNGWKEYDVYRITDFIAKRPLPRLIPPREIELLRAIRTVNRSAKRYRDAAQKHYQLGMHGFSQNSKRKKDQLYKLKDKGIRIALAEGLIHCVGIHDGLACYSGGGYVFHSPQIPEGTFAEDVSSLRVESRPKSREEGRLKDAMFTLESLDDVVIPGLTIRPRPPLTRSPTTRGRRGNQFSWMEFDDSGVSDEWTPGGDEEAYRAEMQMQAK